MPSTICLSTETKSFPPSTAKTSLSSGNAAPSDIGYASHQRHYSSTNRNRNQEHSPIAASPIPPPHQYPSSSPSSQSHKPPSPSVRPTAHAVWAQGRDRPAGATGARSNVCPTRRAAGARWRVSARKRLLRAAGGPVVAVLRMGLAANVTQERHREERADEQKVGKGVRRTDRTCQCRKEGLSGGMVCTGRPRSSPSTLRGAAGKVSA